jgi:DNA-binding IclR family transcriptional regulator
MKTENMRGYNTTIMKAAMILELYTKEDVDEFSISEIASRVEMPMSTTHRILSTLKYLGYIDQSGLNGKYYLGLKCVQLGNRVRIVKTLREASRPYLIELSKRYNEAARVTMNNDDGSLLNVEQITPSRKSFFAIPGVGGTRELQATAAGKCIMAQMPEEELEETIKSLTFHRFTANSIITPNQLKEHLEIVRKQGYAFDNEEGEAGLFCCGAPIYYDSSCIGALSISMPISRVPQARDVLIEDIKNTAIKISDVLK